MAEDETGRGRRARPGWLLGVVNLGAVLLLFFAVPVDTDQSGVRLAVGLVLTLVAALAVAGVVLREVRHGARGERSGLTLLRLVLLVEVVMVAFALCYYTMAVNMDGQFADIATRMDALYFTATTMTTTGFGDAHATGQVARAVVTVHLVFDVVFLGLLARVATGLVTARPENG